MSSSNNNFGLGGPPPNKRQKPTPAEAAPSENKTNKFDASDIFNIKIEPIESIDELILHKYSCTTSPVQSDSEGFQYDDSYDTFSSAGTAATLSSGPIIPNMQESGISSSSSLEAGAPDPHPSTASAKIPDILRPVAVHNPIFQPDLPRGTANNDTTTSSTSSSIGGSTDDLINGVVNKLAPTIRNIIREELVSHRDNNASPTAMIPPNPDNLSSQAFLSSTTVYHDHLESQIKSIIGQLPAIRNQIQNISKNTSNSVSTMFASYQNEIQQFQHQQILAIEKQIQFLEDQLSNTFKEPTTADNNVLTIQQILSIQKLIVKLQQEISNIQKDVATIQDRLWLISVKVGKPIVTLKSQISDLQHLQGKFITFYSKTTLLMDKVYKKGPFRSVGI